MKTKTIDCVECGEKVSYGRLSCPACGALLASVAGTPARPALEVTSSPGPEAADPNLAAHAVDEMAEIAVAPDQIALPLDDAGDVAAATVVAEPAERAPAVEAETGIDDEATETGAAEPAALELEPAAFSLSPEPTAALPTAIRTPFDGPEPILVARPYGHRVDVTGARSGQAPPSAYRAPALALSTAAASAGSGPWPSQTMTVAPRSSIAPAEAAAANATVDDGARVEATRFAEIGTWFVIVGAAMTVLGFLLPWSRVVIGSRSLGGYLDTWGLASPTHVVILLGALAILALGILRTSVPVWLWAGVLALALGGVLVGLTWPYQFGPLGADVGVIMVGLGGLALVIGGGVTSWATRHVEVEPAV